MELENSLESVEEYAGFFSPNFKFNCEDGVTYENVFYLEGRDRIFCLFPVILRKTVNFGVETVLSSTYGSMKSIIIV